MPKLSSQHLFIAEYIEDVTRIDTPAKEERTKLLKRVATGDPEARQAMISGNLRMVIRVAKQFANRGLDFDDLVEEGNIGLIAATEYYQESFGTEFSTYAYSWIKQAMSRAISNSCSVARLPKYMADSIRRWWTTERTLQMELGRPPTEHEIEERMGLSHLKLKALKTARAMYSALKLTDSYGKKDRDSEADIPDYRQVAAEEREYAESVAEAIRMVDSLDERSADIIRMRYGMAPHKEAHTLHEVADKLGITRERVRQLQDIALNKMRSMVNA